MVATKAILLYCRRKGCPGEGFPGHEGKTPSYKLGERSASVAWAARARASAITLVDTAGHCGQAVAVLRCQGQQEVSSGSHGVGVAVTGAFFPTNNLTLL